MAFRACGKMGSSLFRLLCLSILFISVLAHAQVDTLRTVSRHMTLSNGKTLAYTVQMGRVPIRAGGSDEVLANMFFVAYCVSSTEPRPITFLWNGGPGSPSSTLHLESIGPKLIAANGKTVDFRDTALASTDLVFVDAVGTGFSRVTRSEFSDQFYQMRGDVSAFTDFVRAWRLLFGVEEYPIYLAGESWGAFRAAAVALRLEKQGIQVAGIIAISGRPALPNARLDIVLRALRTVQQALAAQYHGKSSTDLPKDPVALQQLVHEWVMSTYVPALEHIDDLDHAQRDAIANRLSEFTGIPEREINRSNLMIYPHQFLTELLHDQRKVLDTYDMRQTTDMSPRENIQVEERYLRHDLGYITDLAYIDVDHVLNGFSPDDGGIQGPNAMWDYKKGFFSTYVSGDQLEREDDENLANGESPRGQETPDTAEAMALDSHLRLLIADGLYDSRSTCAISSEIVARQGPSLQSRIITRCYKGGHMFYLDPEVRRQFSEDLQQFTSDATLPRLPLTR
ncbi:carboxypeptidase-related protein [Acidisarcina polymorpha]|uniref:Carboxypeptidase-related protein n=2 Tax=Acidisarcina polymorpha TaxID=2211140 RepID=A0A2Z5FT07_9BACT|nr:carboxypeptidase-related protein [Acidisarcina polymorpha]